jgi:hypothetical protein
MQIVSSSGRNELGTLLPHISRLLARPWTLEIWLRKLFPWPKKVPLSFLALFWLKLAIWPRFEFCLVLWPFHLVHQSLPWATTWNACEKTKIALPLGAGVNSFPLSRTRSSPSRLQAGHDFWRATSGTQTLAAGDGEGWLWRHPTERSTCASAGSTTITEQGGLAGVGVGCCWHFLASLELSCHS